VVMLSVILLSVVMLSVVMLSVIMLNAMALVLVWGGSMLDSLAFVQAVVNVLINSLC
jgi:hypothetical protein